MKGRPLDLTAQAEIQALLGDAPRRRDLLIEHLHKIQDRYGCISAAHIVALAREMKLATAEVYEVATFYHHFDVIKEGGTAPPAVTVRVCDSLSCEMAGAQSLLGKLKNSLGVNVRVIPAPCVGRCEQAPVAVVGQNPIANATPEKVSAAAKAGKFRFGMTNPAGSNTGFTALLGLAAPADMERLAARIVAEGLSVRSVEEIVAVGAGGPAKGAPKTKKAAGSISAPGLAELGERMSERLDTRVKVQVGRSKGKVVIEFATLDDLQRIVDIVAPPARGVFGELLS